MVVAGGAEMSNGVNNGKNAARYFECGTPYDALPTRMVHYADLKRPFAA